MNSNLRSPPLPRHNRDWSGRALALISLIVALTSLGYSTWRNETTEAHRNVRQASFQMLDQIGQLQQIVDTRYYAGDRSGMTRIAAWGKAALIRDMGPLVSPASAQRAQEVFDTWSAKAEDLDAGRPEAESEISRSLNGARGQVLNDLRVLR